MSWYHAEGKPKTKILKAWHKYIKHYQLQLSKYNTGSNTFLNASISA